MAPSPRKAQTAKKPVRVSSNLWEEDVFASEEAAFLKLAKIIVTLQQQSTRVKVEGLKDNVEKAIQCLDTFKTAREVLQTEWKSKIKLAERDAADNRASQQVKALDANVTEGLQRMEGKLVEHDGVLASLKDSGDGCRNMEGRGTSWTKVIKKSRDARPQAGIPPPAQPSAPRPDAPARANQSARQPRTKPLAIWCPTGGTSFQNY